MAYLPPPPTPLPRGRRPPRWTPPELSGPVADYAAGDPAAGRRLRRYLVPALTRLAEAGLGQRARRQQVAQTAVTVALADLEAEATPLEAVTVAFRAVAHVVLATGHRLPELPRLGPADQALVRLMEVELADPERVARAFALSVASLDDARATAAHRLGLAALPDSDCPGWQEVRRTMRAGDGATAHRSRCGRCALVAELVTARRHRVWPDDPPGGPFAAVFDGPR